MRLHVLFEHSDDGLPHGSSFIRLLRPLQHPANAGAWEVSAGTEYAGGADVVIVERTWRPSPGVLAAAEELVGRLRREGTRLIYSLDDNLLDWTPRAAAQHGPTAEQLSAVRLLAREADGIIATTSALRARLQILNPHVEVIANALDERLLVTSTDPGPAQQRLVIGYMGTYSHDADLGLILAPLRALLRAHADELEFQLIGGAADNQWHRAFDGLPVRVLDGGRPVDYPGFMAWYTERVRWDIAVGPLETTPFTRCKSDIKYLDYAAIGAASAFSRVTPYADSVVDDETGLLVENTGAAWRAALERLVSDSDLRLRLADNARRQLLTERVLSKCATRWQRAILTLARGC